MRPCAGCGTAVTSADPGPSLRDGDQVFHMACAPPALITSASEEYRAILRKGVRYFLDKYGGASDGERNLGEGFLCLGQAIEAERDRRSRT